ncbi:MULTISPECIES: hypothetical protein [unclassified Mesorhizobium]|uniref:hypothetical protein n=1 Tax=unclassified Mesorhizobium TaxID=325217 RepID=UPI000FCB4A89|nr:MULTISPECIES: hypothetical protein [unclassified Mesorhizobium]RUZ76599.1 hypothetical protein EN947_23250 [Mesorhizobium sp. M7A.F.Ca.US.003.02.2.1]RUY96054.1 hypothetical protein EN974_20275 [Mesorhizobium sp. M7A.F.Ca.CA.001.12.2.1]RUZ25237.1 hypothetical protein EN949_14470 [Mesorhizobium sp. M7A.F.Ca.US.007.01.2.1]RUZ49877.1 hypothetical protein EN948_03005 [Mesorhizobium sp. M7A.F.Ca.US.003.02.1.1]RUZ70316.1 hypothetical protein EN950_01065 [Mesorhizobium sp. M7A.F.Ca.US.007.01.1.1]
MQRNLATCLSTALVLSGCAADYLNHYDSVTLTAGDANRANSLAQTVDPFNPNSQNTHIEGDGQRIAGIVQQYRGPANAAAAGGNCPKDGSMAADGSRCGGRSAESRPGGAM